MLARTESKSSSVPAAVLPYGATIFISATLLFLIQPMVAKRLLPWFGGGASVWTTCLVFFQSVLVLGYLYAHWLQRLRHAWQAAVHALLLAGALTLLYVPQAVQRGPDPASAPLFEILRWLALGTGLPYFLLSSTTPLLQAWYVRTSGASLPYRLFALSNLASLVALVAYPFAVEPLTGLDAQLDAWSAAFTVFAIICALVAVRAAMGSGGIRLEPDPPEPAQPWSSGRSLAWAALPACSSALLLSVTNGLSQNIAPVPLLWIAPLALYLVSFVLCFNHDGFYRPAAYKVLVPAALIGLIWTNSGAGASVVSPTVLCLACLFILCMFCHAQLAALKPAGRDLTAFYVSVSIGGAIGGAAVGLVAPALLADVFEVQIAVSACLVLSLLYLYGYRSRLFLIACGIIAVAALRTTGGLSGSGAVTFRGRNFYGALAVREAATSAFGGGRERTLSHGLVLHGGQALSAAARTEPTFYYGRESGVGIALQRPLSAHRVGAIGLGVGTVAAYGRPGDYYRFYELNPLVVELARSRFTYLRDCRARTDVVIGDGRLSLEHEGDQRFDTLVLDAFSGDAIPVHLLTQEAFRCYYRHLNPDGIVAVHVSSEYVDLRPVVADLAAASGRSALLVQSAPRADRLVSRAAWILVSTNREFLRQAEGSSGGVFLQASGRRQWTDRYSNLLTILR